MKEKLKIVALISFIVMCISITLSSVTINTATPANAEVKYVDGVAIKYEVLNVKGHNILVAKYCSDIEVCRID